MDTVPGTLRGNTVGCDIVGCPIVSPGTSSCTIGNVSMSGIGTTFFTSLIAPQYPLGLDITYGGSNLTWTLGVSEQTDDLNKIRTITKSLFQDWLDLVNAPYFGCALIMTNQDGSAFPLLPIAFSIESVNVIFQHIQTLII